MHLIDARALEIARMAMSGQLREHFSTPLGQLPVETFRVAFRVAFEVYFQQAESAADD